MARAKPRHLTSTDVIKVHSRLSELLFKHEQDDQTWVYQPGWTDIRIAEELSIPTSGVARVRNENFGPLRRSGPIETNADNYRACVARIRRIEEFLSSLDSNWSKDIPLPKDMSKVEGF